MKVLSVNLLKFTFVGAILSMTFCVLRDIFFKSDLLHYIPVLVILYVITLITLLINFYRKDGRESRDIGFRYNIAIFIVHNIISIFWFIIIHNRYNISLIDSMALQWELISLFNFSLLWLIILIIHFLVFLIHNTKYNINP